METDSGGHPEKEGGYEPFELQPSLLDAVASLCPESEAEEIWRVVGPSLAEQAGDLLQEAKIHLEIWRELRRDVDHATSPALPEPPRVRERLIQEIRLLANHLCARAGSLTVEGDRSGEILSYALSNSQTLNSGCGHQCSRPQSAISSSDGRDTPLRRATPSSSHDGSQSSILSGGPLEHVSLADIDSTVQHLRESLEEEICQRKQDIAFLQECSDRERDYFQSSSHSQPPSLRELREVGTLLERQVMSETSRGSPPTAAQRELVLPRPPPSVPKSPGSTAVMRRASGIKPHSHTLQPNPTINRPNDGRGGVSSAIRVRLTESETLSQAHTSYSSVLTATTATHCQSIT